MNNFSLDVSSANFQEAVIDASVNTPVIVDFWAEWCEPCKVLKPLLEKLAAEFNGRFILAKVDADTNNDLAQHFGIRSLPTVAAFINGEVVDGFTGAKTESQLREFLARFVPPASTEENTEEVLPLPSPEDEALTKQQAEAAIAAAPFIAALEEKVAAAPNDHAQRLTLAEMLSNIQDYRRALEHLLISVKQDKQWNEAAARKGMLAIFEHLSSNKDHLPLVREYRSLLARTLN